MANLTPNSSFSLSLRLKIPNRAGMLARVTQAIAEAGGNLGDFSLVSRSRNDLIRILHVDASSESHVEDIIKAVESVEEIEILEISDRTFALHDGGKISVESKLELTGAEDLAMAYTPGVGRVCMEIAQHPDRVYDLTIKGNTVAIVTDGSAVLGLGNLGSAGALPVMEGKALLFKKVRRSGRLPYLPRHPGHRRNCRCGQAPFPRLRRHQPGRYQRPPLLRNRRTPAQRVGHSRLPRRPAWHRHRHPGGFNQLPEAG